MRTRRIKRAVALCAVVACTAPATADAAIRKATGETSQGRPVLLWVRDDGNVTLVKFKWQARCRKRGFVWRDNMYFRDRPEGPFQRNGGAFSDGGTFKKRYRGGLRPTFNTHMTGAPAEGGGWEGTFRASVRVFNRRGRMLDYCKTGSLTGRGGPAA
jgi:hypothetical protein